MTDKAGATMDTPLGAIIKQKIRDDGPMSIADYMGLCLGHPEYGYYMTRDPFGTQGDFTTAPEISQIFGELIGAWLVDSWMKLGAPECFTLLECGPGRGTLMADALRATRNVPQFHKALRLTLLETSPVLKQQQKDKLAAYNPVWCSDIEQVAADKPLLVIGNEFLDALPVHQMTCTDKGWQEKKLFLDINDTVCLGEFAVEDALKRHIPKLLIAPKVGDVVEVSPEQRRHLLCVMNIIKKQGGTALFVDYGFIHNVPGNTLQAVKKHTYCDVLDSPGEVDITAHVNFGDLGVAAMENNMVVHGPVSQGAFLSALGAEARATHLKNVASQAGNQKQVRDIEVALRRLCGEDTKGGEMGALFKVIAFCANPSVELAGF